MKKTLKRAPAVFFPVVAAAANGITAFAAETGGASAADTATASLLSGITDMASSVASAIEADIPVAIPIVGAVLLVIQVIRCIKTWMEY